MHDAPSNAFAATLRPVIQILRLAAVVVCIGWVAGALAGSPPPADAAAPAVAVR